jgi:hypothetical protein
MVLPTAKPMMPGIFAPTAKPFFDFVFGFTASQRDDACFASARLCLFDDGFGVVWVFHAFEFPDGWFYAAVLNLLYAFTHEFGAKFKVIFLFRST